MPTSTSPEVLSAPARRFLAREHELLIDGDWTRAADGGTFETVDPATGLPIARVAHAGQADVDEAVRAARRALEQGAWSTISAADRGLLLYRLADLLEQHADELAQLEALDNGKPIRHARALDIASAIAELRHFAGWPERITGDVVPVAQREMLCYTRQEPVGVCGQIIPWNFPLVMACWKLGPALAAGCTVVLKPAEQTPLSALRLGELALDAGIPAGVLNVITGDGATGAALVDHPGVDKIAFTGSTQVGVEIGIKAARMLKRVTLELGGKSPNIILSDADLQAAMRGAFQAMYFNSGQACNAGSRLYVPSDRLDEVVSTLAERARETRVGPGLDPRTQLGPLISDQQRNRVKGYVDAGVAEGAELVCGGTTGEPRGGYFVPPTLFVAPRDDLSIVREEIFGPVLVALPYQSLEEVVARANDTRYGLAAGVWTHDARKAHKLAAMLQAGSVYVNCWGPSDPGAPFGGYKTSGIGREHGRLGLDGYLETKTVWTSLAG
jgi:acyl-CoA reductase-like NAD-dependent aldehyde dehydrogenase